MQILISCNSKISFLDSIFQKDADAVDARSEIDLRTGAAFTRFQTKLLQGKYHETQGVMLSYGPCQFPTLGLGTGRGHSSASRPGFHGICLAAAWFETS